MKNSHVDVVWMSPPPSGRHCNYTRLFYTVMVEKQRWIYKTAIMQSHLVEACLQQFDRGHRHLDAMSLSSDSSAGHVVTMD